LLELKDCVPREHKDCVPREHNPSNSDRRKKISLCLTFYVNSSWHETKCGSTAQVESVSVTLVVIKTMPHGYCEYAVKTSLLVASSNKSIGADIPAGAMVSVGNIGNQWGARQTLTMALHVVI